MIGDGLQGHVISYFINHVASFFQWTWLRPLWCYFPGAKNHCFALCERTRGGNPPALIWTVIPLHLLFFSSNKVKVFKA